MISAGGSLRDSGRRYKARLPNRANNHRYFGGQLSTVRAKVWLPDLATPGLVVGLVVLGVVAALVGFYTEMTRRQLWQLPSPPPTASAPARANQRRTRWSSAAGVSGRAWLLSHTGSSRRAPRAAARHLTA